MLLGSSLSEIKANQPTKNTSKSRQTARTSRWAVLQLLAVVLSRDRSYWPQQHRQARNYQSKNKHAKVEMLVFEKTDLLKNEEGIIQLKLPMAGGVFLEAHVVLSMHFAVKKWSNLLKLF